MRAVDPGAVTDQFRMVKRAFVDEARRAGRLRAGIAEEHGHALDLVPTVVRENPTLLTDDGCKEGCIVNGYVLLSARGRGGGRLLVRSAPARAVELGIGMLTQHANDAGTPLGRSQGLTAHDRHMVRSVPADVTVR